MNKTKLTLQEMFTMAENLDWMINEEEFGDNRKGYNISIYSPAGQDFNVSLETGDDSNWQEPQKLFDALKNYIRGFVPFDEAQLWIRDGRGQNGAPEDPMDVIADMQACKDAMQELLDAWSEDELETCTHKHTVRLHITFRKDMAEKTAIEIAVAKLLADARAHTHTVEDGVKIDFIEDCGEAN